MKQIALSKGQFALVDDDKYEELASHKWCVNAQGYARRSSTKQEREAGTASQIRMSRYLLGVSSTELCDHINGDRLDNRCENLRKATKSQNMANSKMHVKTSSIFKGVYRYKANKKWQAYIGANGIQVHLGCFYSERDAALAYNTAAMKLFGEFARLNDLAQVY